MAAAAESSDRDLLQRSIATLARSWGLFAESSPGGRLIEESGAAIAVFRHPTDASIFNNAIVSGDPARTGPALDAIERAYAGADHAVWVHEADAAVAEQVKERGYSYDSSTRAMAAPLDETKEVEAPALKPAEPAIDRFREILELPPDLLPEWHGGAHLYVAERDGRAAVTAMAFDHDGDCGIYNVGTARFARRRGLATALTSHLLREARARGCATASLQSTDAAFPIYAALGFRDLGRFDEYVRR